MKRKLFFHFIIISLIGSGCTTLAKKLYGVKDPAFMNNDRIMRFQEEIGFKEIPFFGLKPEAWKQGKSFPIPEVLVFDAKGRHIPYADPRKPNCNGPAEMFLSELHLEKSYQFSDSLTLDSFLEMAEGPECMPVEFYREADVDFYIFMTYATFMGKKLSREKTVIWYESLKNNGNIRYRLFMLNQDLKECWSQEQKLWFDDLE